MIYCSQKKMEEDMKTLYEILEVSETASKEIIEKAYKVLVKRYHPDLQPQDKKENAEKIMKQINEAYNVLIDDAKRKAYDEELKQSREEQQNSYYNSSYQNENNNYQNSNSVNEQYNNANQYKNVQEELIKKQEQKMQEELKRQMEMQKDIRNQYERKYQKAYENYLRSLGYKIKYKWTWKRIKDLLITISIIIIICLILWIIPFTHNIIINFYESNPIIKGSVQILGKILQAIWNAICSIFTQTNKP